MNYIKCANFTLCQKMLPAWWFKAMKKRTCTNCHIFYGEFSSIEQTGELKFNDGECIKCKETKKCLESPDCDHIFCPDCFRKIQLRCDICFQEND